MITIKLCRYCLRERPASETDFHDCPQAQQAKCAIEASKASMRALVGEHTSESWDPHRKRRLDSVATSINLTGGEVGPKEN
jgi:hypothetical protein